MAHDIVQCSQGVTLVGAGPVEAGVLTLARGLAPVLVAADGGVQHCLSIGLVPSAIIGDFDSVSEQDLNAAKRAELLRVEEQESTDFEKCLERIMAPYVLAVGVTGGRVDHELAVWSVLARHVGPPTLVLGDEDLIFAAPNNIELDLPIGTRVSLFPMTELEGTSEGLEWPIDGFRLSPTGKIGTSNRSTGLVRLSMPTPGCLVILPKSVLEIALSALVG